jgi:hypothetical protein
MALGLLDLYLITDQLIQQLKDCTTATKLWEEESAEEFNIHWTGHAPDAAWKEDGCRVSVYLFHVAADRFNRNTYPIRDAPPAIPGPGIPRQKIPAQRIPQQPLALTLYYLIAAHSADYVEEQRAMSIALKCFHEHPIVTATVPSGDQEFTLTLEPLTIDEVGRLWQAFSTAMRVSAVYRVNVVFIEAPEPTIPKPVLPPPPEPQVNTDSAARVSGTVAVGTSGRGTVTIAGADFSAGRPVVQVRPFSGPAAATLKETATDPPGPGQFRVVDATTLDLAIPANTVAKRRYVLHVRPAPGKGVVDLWLVVP